MMRALLIAFLLLSIVSVSALAQSVDSNKKYRLPRYTVKWSPFHAVINHYPTIQLALEQRINKKISFQYDFGFVIPVTRTSNRDNSTASRMRGYKAKFEIRHYLLDPDNHLWLPYVGVEYFYNRVNYNKSEAMGMNCADGTCDYYQFVTYGMKYREQGVNLKGGVVFRVHRFCLDFQIGVAGRFINYSDSNKPSPGILLNDEDDEINFTPFGSVFKTIEEDRTVISPTACIRVGYIIR
jgi:hypothetical protein